jgi:hypothetical protein
MRRSPGDRRPLVLAAVLAACAALPAAARAAAPEARVEARADRTTLAEDELLVLTVRVEGAEAPSAVDLGEDRLPFEIVARSQGRQTTFSFGSGIPTLRSAVVLTLQLRPRRTGTLEIPPVVATVKGRRVASAPIRVTVTPAGTGTGPPAASGAPGRPGPDPVPDRRGGSAWRGWERDLALRVEVDRREPFLGEQVTASVWLLSPVGVVGTEAYRPPLYAGFWAEELETPQKLAWQTRTVNGVPVRAYLLQRVALFPTRAGRAEIGPYQVDLAVRLGTDSPFDLFPEIRRVRRQSAPVSLEVKPLPAGAPAGFDAVDVGAFALEASASEARVAAGQPVAIRVTARGEGNLRALSLPPVPTVPGARRFEPTVSDDVAPRGLRLAGTRTVETVLVPERAGALVVPPLSWPVFDPRTGTYAVLRTAELRVEVTEGAAAPAAGPAEDPVVAALRPVRGETALARRGAPPWRSVPFAAATLLAPLAFAILAGLGAARERARAAAPERRVRGAGRRARHGLAGARRRLRDGDGPGAVEAAQRALAGWAADRLGRPATGLTRDALAAELLRAGAPHGGVTALGAALDGCDAARFGGAAGPEDVVALAERAIDALEGGEA